MPQIVWGLLLLWLGISSVSCEQSKLITMKLTEDLFRNKVCIIWAAMQAQKDGLMFVVPAPYAVFKPVEGVLSKAPWGAVVTEVDCPNMDSLISIFSTDLLWHRYDVFTLAPASSSIRRPYHHMHLSSSTVNGDRESFLFSKFANSKLAVTCEHEVSSIPESILRTLQSLNVEILDMCASTQLTAMDTYYIAASADLVVATANTDLSLFIILDRRMSDLWTAEIGESSTDLYGALHKLFDRVPWVFTYNDAPVTAEYDYMMHGAVLSSGGRYHTYSIFSGNMTSDVVAWMRARGVQMISHSPTWGDSFWEKVKPFRTANLKHSHLYDTKETVVGTWQRIDIPQIHVLQQYRYVLFTDTDVFFHRTFSLAEIDHILPDYVSMGPEMQDMFPYNAGVMIMNIKNLSHTYNDFLAFILSNTHGLYFPNYGPGDQGAYNQFYETHIRRQMLPKIFNAKPYHAYHRGAYIVHFHGAKPHDYLRFFTSGTCRFGTLCYEGIYAGFCEYAQKWWDHCADDFMCNRVRRMCLALQPMVNACAAGAGAGA